MNSSLNILLINTNLKKTDFNFYYLIKLLNLRGYEIENYGTFLLNLKNLNYLKKKKKNIQNVYFQIKVPSHRLELLKQNVLLMELSSIINIKINNIWNLNRSGYINNINSYNNKNFSWNLQNYIFFNNQIRVNSWIKKKLIEANLIPTNTILDIFSLVSLEFNVTFRFFSYSDTFIFFSLDKSIDSFIYPFLFDRLLTLLNLYLIKKLDQYPIRLNKIFKKFESSFISSLIRPKCIISLPKSNFLSLRKSTFQKYFNLKNWDLNIFKNFKIPIISLTKKKIYFLMSPLRTDIVKEINLIDEYCKFYDLDKVNKNLYLKNLNEKHSQFIYQDLKIFIRNYFISKGFQDLITNPLLKYTKNEESFLLIENSLTAENIKLRSTIVESLLNQFEKKRQKLHSLSKIKFFEIGRVFKKKFNKIIKEENHIGILFEALDKKDTFPKSWFEIKSLLENFFKNFPVLKIYSTVDLLTLNEKYYYHPYKTIQFFSNDKKIGTLGLLNPKLKRKLKLTDDIFLVEINLSELEKVKIFSLNFSFKSFSKFPLITRDLSLNISKEANFYNIQQSVNTISPFILNSFFFDMFLINEKNNILNLSLKLELSKLNQNFHNEEIQKMLLILYKMLKSLYQIDIK
jgi:hypothetical protein